MMNVIDSPQELSKITRRYISANEEIGFVPTMGNLHKGHIELIKTAKQKCKRIIVSIFVNQMQFGPNEDFASYPRTIKNDLEILQEYKVDVVFLPNAQTIYPNGINSHTKVTVPTFNNILCGKFRPGFFDGVTTIVNKLFNMVNADYAFFGEKDYQQLLCVNQMVSDLCLKTKIIAVPIVRENNGLAMSSRNQYLTSAERNIASLLYATLQNVREEMQKNNNHEAILEENKNYLTKNGFKVDYLTALDAKNLQIINKNTQNVCILVAAFLGKARLIDNMIFPWQVLGDN